MGPHGPHMGSHGPHGAPNFEFSPPRAVVRTHYSDPPTWLQLRGRECAQRAIALFLDTKRETVFFFIFFGFWVIIHCFLWAPWAPGGPMGPRGAGPWGPWALGPMGSGAPAPWGPMGPQARWEAKFTIWGPMGPIWGPMGPQVWNFASVVWWSRTQYHTPPRM